MISERDLGFLEGMIEGEGYLGLNKSKTKRLVYKRGFQWKPVLSVANDDVRLLIKLKEICKGGFLARKGGRKREFRLTSGKIREILPQLRLIGKKAQAELLLETLELLEENRHKKNSEKRDNDPRLEEIYEEIKRLNSSPTPLC